MAFLVALCLPLLFAQGKEPAPQPQPLTVPDSLLLDGVPALPADLPDEIGRYTDSRSAGFADWNPAKSEMLILTRFGDTNQVHLVTQPGGARTQLTFYPDRVNDAVFDRKDGAFFIFSKSAGGNEFNQNYRYDFATGKVTLLSDGKSRNSLPRESRDGRLVAYTSTRRDGTDDDIYLQDPREPKSDHLIAQVKGGGWNVADFSPDDRQLLVGEEISINESYLWLIDTKTGNREELTPRPAAGAEKISYALAAFANDGKGIFVTTDRDSEFQRLAYIDLATKECSYLLPEAKFDVDDWDLSGDGQHIAYTLNENGVSTLHVIDVAIRDGKMEAKPQPDPTFDPPIPPSLIFGLKWHRDAGKNLLAFDVSGARSPSDVYTWSPGPAKNVATRWTMSETGGMPADRFVEPQLVKWKSFDGREISGFLSQPDGRKFPGARPVIINIHGGPESQARPGFAGRE
jgi:dipeptidyl aminopeptidase/acylaminoacyl peptidase